MPARVIPVPLTIEDVNAAVGEAFDMDPVWLWSRSRARHRLVPRQIAIFLCRVYTEASNADMGEAFNRYHTAISNSVQRGQNMAMGVDGREIQEKIRGITNVLDHLVAERHRAAPPWTDPDRPMADNLKPCPRCIDAHRRRKIKAEMVQPLYEPEALNPLAREGWEGHTCHDCAAAETLQAQISGAPLNFDMMRVSVGVCRSEELRLSGMSGLVRAGVMKRSPHGALEPHVRWLQNAGIVDAGGWPV